MLVVMVAATAEVGGAGAVEEIHVRVLVGFAKFGSLQSSYML